jgi:branched-chain amino acid transport system substrate-binding protein
MLKHSKAAKIRTGVAAIALVVLTPLAMAAKEPIKIGVPTSLTGAWADIGEQVKRAVTLAADEANAAGGVDGRKVEIEFADTQTKPDMARQQAEKLTKAGYKLLTGTLASGEVFAMEPMLARWDALYMATINKADDLTEKSCNPRLFRVNRPDYSDASVIGPWLKTRNEAKWAFIGNDLSWGHSAGRAFKEKLKDTPGKELVLEIFPPFGTNDYAPYIQKIRDSGAQGVWIAITGRDAIAFATQAKQFGLTGNVFMGGISFVIDTTVKALGETTKGMGGAVAYTSTLDLPTNKAFVARWDKKYPGTQPTNYEGETYMGMQVLLQAVKKANSIKPMDVKKALEDGQFDTILGKQTMRKSDHQLTAPNHFGYVAPDAKGTLRLMTSLTIPADVASRSPTNLCKFN